MQYSRRCLNTNCRKELSQKEKYFCNECSNVLSNEHNVIICTKCGRIVRAEPSDNGYCNTFYSTCEYSDISEKEKARCRMIALQKEYFIKRLLEKAIIKK